MLASFGVSQAKDKSNSHSLAYLCSQGKKELKRDASYYVVFIASASNKVTLIALGLYTQLILQNKLVNTKAEDIVS